MMIDNDVRDTISREYVVRSGLMEINRNDALGFIQDIVKLPIEKNAP